MCNKHFDVVEQGPEFIFPVEVRRKSWNDTWFDRVGTCYMTGLAMGGVWGLWDGINSRELAAGSSRLRATAIINGLTRRGPFLGNTTAVLGETTAATSSQLL